MEYLEFLKTKGHSIKRNGFDIGINELNPKMFDFQKATVKWALKLGKSAIFFNTGLGKTICQIEFAHHVNRKTKEPILILAPLAVSQQTKREGIKFNIDVNICGSHDDVINGINITNYEKLDKFKCNKFSGIVLDESGIMKSYSGHFRNYIIEQFKDTPYKLACTATPAPNDYMELGNHSEFLDVMSRVEMLATFFINDAGDTGKWILKGHAEKDFWKWITEWAVMIRKPSDIGYNDNDFILPKLNIKEHTITSNQKIDGELFVIKANTLNERLKARRSTIKERTDYCSKLINGDTSQWLIWCGLNDESLMLKQAVKDSVEIKGSDSIDHKEKSLVGFSQKKISKIVTKAKIAGYGLNFQNCNNMVFVGLNDSFESMYQSIRRCWRYGQKKEVNVHIITSDIEGDVLKNIRRKESDFNKMYDNMIKNMSSLSANNINYKHNAKEVYLTDTVKTDDYTIHLGDSVDIIKKIKSNYVGYSVFSPPFANLFCYSNSTKDIGNCKNYEEFFDHFSYLIKELYRITMDGRLCTFHCIDIPAMKERDGYIGLKDFPSDLIKSFEKEGWIYHSKHIIWKDPLIEATRTKALGLMHKQLTKDSSKCRAGLPDYLITMRKPGENKKPIDHPSGLIHYAGSSDFSKYNGEKRSHHIWRAYASPVWMDIRQTKTLNARAARENKDTKHICPLQLDTIDRAITLWSNEGDVVFSPFMGVGSEGYVSIKKNRKFIGIELKKSYFDQSIKNLNESLKVRSQDRLF